MGLILGTLWKKKNEKEEIGGCYKLLSAQWLYLQNCHRSLVKKTYTKNTKHINFFFLNGKHIKIDLKRFCTLKMRQYF
jgi:hypothetical protein